MFFIIEFWLNNYGICPQTCSRGKSHIFTAASMFMSVANSPTTLYFEKMLTWPNLVKF